MDSSFNSQRGYGAVALLGVILACSSCSAKRGDVQSPVEETMTEQAAASTISVGQEALNLAARVGEDGVSYMVVDDKVVVIDGSACESSGPNVYMIERGQFFVLDAKAEREILQASGTLPFKAAEDSSCNDVIKVTEARLCCDDPSQDSVRGFEYVENCSDEELYERLAVFHASALEACS